MESNVRLCKDIKGSRDAIRYGLKNGLIDDVRWMDTITDRNRTSYTYNEETAREMQVDIIEIYQSLFTKFEATMEQFALSNDVLSRLRTVFAKHPEIDSVILYDSRTKGTFSPFSDVDITIIGENLNKNLITMLIFEIDDLLLPYMFDISLYSKITNPDVVAHIKRVGFAKTMLLKFEEQ